MSDIDHRNKKRHKQQNFMNSHYFALRLAIFDRRRDGPLCGSPSRIASTTTICQCHREGGGGNNRSGVDDEIKKEKQKSKDTN